MTHHINLIAGNKHRQLARQVGVVVEIISTGLMAPINFSAITFIPGVEFTFGSFNFTAGVDGRLHVSNLEATSIGPTDLDRADRIFTRSASEPDSDRLGDRFVLPRYPFGLVIRLTRSGVCSTRLWRFKPNAKRIWANTVGWSASVARPMMSAERSTSSSSP